MSEKYHQYVKILGIDITGTPKTSLLRKITEKVLRNRKFLIVTPNPEQIMKAQNDEFFRSILNSAKISVADGVGLAAAAAFLNLPSPKIGLFKIPLFIFQGIKIGTWVLLKKELLERGLNIIKGRELFLEIIKIANRKGWKVVLVGNAYRSAQKACLKLQTNYKKVQLFAFTGPSLREDGNCLTSKDLELEKEIIGKINLLKPNFLFVGFRAPVQEKWLKRWLPQMDVSGAMVVGSTFDYLSGKSKIPPKWIEKMGLEWLWRLLTGSQKVGRIWNAAVVFPYKVFLRKLHG